MADYGYLARENAQERDFRRTVEYQGGGKTTKTAERIIVKKNEGESVIIPQERWVCRSDNREDWPCEKFDKDLGSRQLEELLRQESLDLWSAPPDKIWQLFSKMRLEGMWRVTQDILEEGGDLNYGVLSHHLIEVREYRRLAGVDHPSNEELAAFEQRARQSYMGYVRRRLSTDLQQPLKTFKWLLQDMADLVAVQGMR